MQDMQEVTQEVHYENYRHQKLASGAPDTKSVPSTPRQKKFAVHRVALLLSLYMHIFLCHKILLQHVCSKL